MIKQGLAPRPRSVLAGGNRLAGAALLLGALLAGELRTGAAAGRRRSAFFDSGVRWASREEQNEAINVPALFVTLGLCLIVIGAFCDPSRKLV